MTQRKLQLFTIGYAGLTPDKFLEELAKQKINMLVDVRQRAGSRKRGFAKSALISATAQNNIQYVHFSLLGTPVELRRNLKAGEIQLADYFNRYRDYAVGQDESLAQLLALVEQKRCCLLCVERVPEDCHRAIVADLLRQFRPNSFQIEHIVLG